MLEETYTINTETLALIPSINKKYETVVIENDKILFVKQTPLEIIEHTLYQQWTTYEGRRKVVMHYTSYQRRVPIPIDIINHIVAIPTHTERDENCKWIIYSQIANFFTGSNDEETIIVFKNDQHMKLDISSINLRKQCDRAMTCIAFTALTSMHETFALKT